MSLEWTPVCASVCVCIHLIVGTKNPPACADAPANNHVVITQWIHHFSAKSLQVLQLKLGFVRIEIQTPVTSISSSDMFHFLRMSQGVPIIGHLIDMNDLYSKSKQRILYKYICPKNEYFMVCVTLGCLHCCPHWFSKHISVVRCSDLFWKIPDLSVI